MPIPKPRKGEKERKFIRRCVRTLAKEGKRYTNKQRVAICYDEWRDR